MNFLQKLNLNFKFSETETSSRAKRSLNYHANLKKHDSPMTLPRNPSEEAYMHHYLVKLLQKRNALNYHRKRRTSDVDQAYLQYYQKIKQKYQNYVKNLLGFHRALNDGKKFQLPENRWTNNYGNPNILQSPNTKISERNQYTFSDYGDQAASYLIPGKIAIPNINEYSRYNYPHKNQENQQILERNSFNILENNLRNQPISRHNSSDLINQLKSQIVRRRRKRNTLAVDEDGNDADPKEGRKRKPCEELEWDSFANISIVRAGKGPERNSVGSILFLECNAGFKLNIKGENATARCIRGIWKPELPKCIPGKQKFWLFLYLGLLIILILF